VRDERGVATSTVEVPTTPAPRGGGRLGTVTVFSFGVAATLATLSTLALACSRYITLAPQYSESARARSRRLNRAEQRSNLNWNNFQNNFVAPSKGSETVEWLNAALRKVWRVYMKQIERWIERRLQRAIDGAVLRRKIKQRRETEEGDFSPLFKLNSVKLVELKLDYQPPVIRAIESRSESRRDSEIGAIATVRYTGGMRALFMIEVSISLQDERGEDMAEWQQRMWRGYMSMEDEDKGLSSSAALAPLSLSRPWQIRIPVQVYDLDIESELWIRAKMAPLAPYVGQLSLAFVDSPAVGVQLAPYKRAQLMRIPIIQSFLTKLITEDLPNLMILPRKLNFEIPPSLAAVAGAAIGEDIVKRAILNAVVNEESEDGEEDAYTVDISKEKLDEVEKNLMSQGQTEAREAAQVQPSKTSQEMMKMVDPRVGRGRRARKPREKIEIEKITSDADATAQLKDLVKPWTQGGITLPQVFQGELLVTLNSARGLSIWTGIPGMLTMSSPYCLLQMGKQVDYSRKYTPKTKKAKNPLESVLGLNILQYEDKALQTEPVWNQEFQFLVQDASKDELLIQVKDSEFTGRPDIGYVILRVADLEAGIQTPVWLTLQPPPSTPGVIARAVTSGEIFIEATYRAFQDDAESSNDEDASDETDVSARAFQSECGGANQDHTDQEEGQITDIRSAAEASSKAGITSSMTARALAITKAASVRASLALKRFNKDKKTVSAEIVNDEDDSFPDNGSGAKMEDPVSESRVQRMMEVLQERFERDEVTSEKRAAKWIARSDRPWFQLVSFLLGVVILLLVLVAWRLDLAIQVEFPSIRGGG